MTNNDNLKDMKTILKLILVSLTVFLFSASAFAANPKKYFEALSTVGDFNYTYISPYMLKAMGGSHINSGGLSISSSDISLIETLSTYTSGTNNDLWDTIRKVKKDNDLETLSTKKEGYYRYDVLGKLSSNGKVLTHLLVITQNGGNNVSVVYIVGKIPMDEISSQFN
ncbi:MAG: DUF4252 domain-containing protein [Bacteroides sp.]|nr:DUF4252 domain-containing protein [Bacteroides sp.]